MGKGGGGGEQAPILEPVKTAEQAMTDAKDTATRSQRLRRAIAGTFSRSSMSGYSSGASTTAGASAKLGS